MNKIKTPEQLRRESFAANSLQSLFKTLKKKSAQEQDAGRSVSQKDKNAGSRSPLMPQSFSPGTKNG